MGLHVGLYELWASIRPPEGRIQALQASTVFHKTVRNEEKKIWTTCRLIKQPKNSKDKKWLPCYTF